MVHLYQAKDADQSYGLRLAGDPLDTWRWERGYGKDFEKVWTVELQSEGEIPGNTQIDWEAVLDRVLEAYQLSDPVISNYHWPVAAT